MLRGGGEGRNEGARGSAGASLPAPRLSSETLGSAEGPLEPPPRAWGSPNPAPVGSRTLASLAAGPWTLHLGLRLPALKARLRGPGLREGAGAAPSQGCAASARSSEPSPDSDAGCGSARAPLGCAPRGGREGRGGEGSPQPASASGLAARAREGGGRCWFLLAAYFKLPSHLRSCVHPSIHTARIHSSFMPLATPR